jgi:hypothetical protein
MIYTKICTCGCDTEFTTSEKRSKYMIGHVWRGKSHSKETKEKLSKIRMGTKASEETKRKIGAASALLVRTKEHRENISRSQKGHVDYSPFIPGQLVSLNSKHDRWYCNIRAKNSRTGKPMTMTHAKAVYEHHYGPVSEGYHVHHINGQHEKLTDDNIGNLMLLTREWNSIFMPTLAKMYSVPEADVTREYIALQDTYSGGRLVFEIGRSLLLKSDPYLEV